MKQHKFQDLRESNSPYFPELTAAAERVITSGRYLFGPETEAFEAELAKAIGTDHAIGTSNGLDSIRLIFRALIETGRLKKGDRVMVPANTFIASVLPLTDLGLLPQLIDPEEETMAATASLMADRAEADTKAALLVHLYGYPASDEEGLRRLAEKGIIVVEDNAQAIGAATAAGGKAIPTGNAGIASAISFYPGKNIGALGDSGAVCTSDADLAATIRSLGNYGGSKRYYYDYLGYNNRIDELQAAFLRVKLPHIAEERDRRAAVADAYDAAIVNPIVRKAPRPKEGIHGWHQYVVRCARRDELQSFLAEHGVQTLIHYPVAPHQQNCYASAFNGPFPVAERLAAEVLSLPVANISAGEAREIAGIINSFR